MKFFRNKKNRHEQGLTFVEVTIAILILAVTGVSVLSMLNLALRVISENKIRTGAIAISNEALETVRNLPYLDVGTVGGIVSGVLPQTETVTLNDADYTVTTSVMYVDDAFDGTVALGTDGLGNDYKLVRITVAWEGRFTDKEVIGVTTIAPRGIETNEGGGVLKISVIDADGAPVSQASIHVINGSTVPPIDDSTPRTNYFGEFISSVPAASGYQIVITKNGYSSDYNCAIDPVGTGCSASVGNPTPTKPQATVLEGQLTETSFAIDQLATLRVNTISQNNLPTEWVINTDSSGEDQQNPAIALGPDGNYYFAWQDFRNSAARIYGQDYDGATAQWTPDVAITTSNNQNGPDIALDAFGGLYVTWQDDKNGNQDIYFDKYDSAGSSLWGGAKKVNTDSGSADQFFPKVVTSPTTTESIEFVSWMDTRAGGGDSDIYLQKYNGDGINQWSSETKVNFVSSTQFQATDTGGWTFSNPLSYLCDDGNCDGGTDVEVTGNFAQLVPTQTCQGTPSACTTFLAQSTCTAQAGCSWDAVGPCENGSCQCSQLSDQTSCQSATGCDWTPGVQGCTGNCDCWEISNRGRCQSVAGCAWFIWFCYPTTGCSCGNITSEPVCTDAACGWETLGGNCSGSCGCSDISTDPLCTQLSCNWDASGPCSGTPTACTALSAQGTCLAQAGCSWTPAGGYPSDNPTVVPLQSLEISNLVSWDSFAETATKNGGQIYYQLSDNDGQTWKYWNGSTWSTAGATDYSTAAVVNTNIGDFPNTKDTLLIRAFLDGDGSQQIQLDQIDVGYTYTSSGGSYSQSVDTAVSPDMADNVFIAWEAYTTDYDIFLQKVDTAGSVVWANDIRVNTTATGDQNNPSVALDSSSNIYVAWQDNRSGTNRIYLQKYDTDGNVLWTAGDVAVSVDSSGIQRNPRIVVDSNGNVYVAWQDNRNGDNDIYLQFVDADGNRLWENDVRVNTSTTADQSNVDIILNESGNVVLVWQDNQSGNYDAVAAEYGGDPSSTSPIPNVPLTITGAKQVGSSPVIYKYSQSHTTNASGALTLPTMEWDSYTIQLGAGSGYTLITSDPVLPVVLDPAQDLTVNLTLE